MVAWISGLYCIYRGISWGVVTSGVVTTGTKTSGAVTSGVVTTGTKTSGIVTSGVVTTGTKTSGIVTSGIVISGLDTATMTSGIETPGTGTVTTCGVSGILLCISGPTKLSVLTLIFPKLVLPVVQLVLLSFCDILWKSLFCISCNCCAILRISLDDGFIIFWKWSIISWIFALDVIGTDVLIYTNKINLHINYTNLIKLTCFYIKHK